VCALEHAIIGHCSILQIAQLGVADGVNDLDILARSAVSDTISEPAFKNYKGSISTCFVCSFNVLEVIGVLDCFWDKAWRRPLPRSQ
jgi:hypothetical protein